VDDIVVDDLGVAATTLPDPAATIRDSNGVPVPGDQVLVLLADGRDAETATTAAAGELTWV